MTYHVSDCILLLYLHLPWTAGSKMTVEPCRYHVEHRENVRRIPSQASDPTHPYPNRQACSSLVAASTTCCLAYSLGGHKMYKHVHAHALSHSTWMQTAHSPWHMTCYYQRCMVPSWDLMDVVAQLTWITCRPAARAPKGPSQQFGTLPSTCGR